jgi:pimeloyl-ACP methyl ester carboxylesterase
MLISRRALFGATLASSAAALFSAPASARGNAALPSSEELEPFEISLSGGKIAQRCLLLVPRASKPSRLLVLCHGLGETASEGMGIRAWAERYGLLSAYHRLSTPPVSAFLPEKRLYDEALGRRINESLARAPFRGFAIACPFTPNVYKARSTDVALERYAAWIHETLLPELKARLSLGPERSRIAIDGVSLGGYVSLEVFLRRPDSFGAVGTVQGAFGVSLAEIYAARLEKVFKASSERFVRIASSSQDPFRAGAERLSTRLREKGFAPTFSLTKGPHDQYWLREMGTLELLYDHSRRFDAGVAGVVTKAVLGKEP